MYFLDEVSPRIFIATFHDHYHLCMSFIRYTEGYEGLHPKFRTSPFMMSELHEYESRRGPDLSFSYVTEWTGFNLTGKTIQNVIQRGIIDINRWDEVLMGIWAQCAAQYPDLKFSLIGVSRPSMDDDPDIVPHEMAHAYFANSNSYMMEMERAFDAMPELVRDHVTQILSAWDYPSKVLIDETQAYLATGLDGIEEFEILGQMIDLDKVRQPFQDIFRKYNQSNFTRRIIYPHIK